MDVDILSAAEEILGPAVRVERHRDWAIFWCPFHNDSDRAGRGGHPNFGVHLRDGYWKCLRCGASGGSLKSLSYKLGINWKPPVSAAPPRRPERPPTQVEQLDEALAEARSNVQRSPAWGYLAERGLRPYTSLVYGLGYGQPLPAVHQEVIQAANQSLMLRRDGTWLWAGGVVYADPPTHPAVLNVRYIPAGQLPKGTRRFTPKKNHKTWGRRVHPLGTWRITGRTRTLVVLEGLFDMLLTAQKLHELGREADTVAIYTNGASPSAKMLAWFADHNRYEYVLIRDPDKAGEEWEERVSEAIRYGGAPVETLCPPETLDPDEAILNGWWPSAI
jgi:hypothetical protein